LIPYNKTETGYDYKEPLDKDIIKFHKVLTDNKIKATIRWSTRGARDVNGACGQLVLNVNKSNEVKYDIEDLGNLVGTHKSNDFFKKFGAIELQGKGHMNVNGKGKGKGNVKGKDNSSKMNRNNHRSEKDADTDSHGKNRIKTKGLEEQNRNIKELLDNTGIELKYAGNTALKRIIKVMMALLFVCGCAIAVADNYLGFGMGINPFMTN